MKIRLIGKYAEFVGYTLYHGERINEWRCPNKKCGMGVSEEHVYCPYCGQKIKFKEPPEVKRFKDWCRMNNDLISRSSVIALIDRKTMKRN